MKKVMATVAAFLLVGSLSMNAQQEPAKRDTSHHHQGNGQHQGNGEHKGNGEHHQGGNGEHKGNGENKKAENSTTTATPKN